MYNSVSAGQQMQMLLERRTSPELAQQTLTLGQNEDIESAKTSLFTSIARVPYTKFGFFRGSSPVFIDEIRVVKDLAIKTKTNAFARTGEVDSISGKDVHEFYIVDIGAGTGAFGKLIYNYVNSQEFKNFMDAEGITANIKFHIVSTIGEGMQSTMEFGERANHYYVTKFKVEDIDQAFRDINPDDFKYNITGEVDPGNRETIEIDLLDEDRDAILRLRTIHGKIDLAISSWCFIHLVDPMGLVKRTFDMLRPGHGVLAVDGLYFVTTENLSDHAQHQKDFIMCLLLSGQPFLIKESEQPNAAPAFLIKRKDESELMIPIRYNRRKIAQFDNTFENYLATYRFIDGVQGSARYNNILEDVKWPHLYSIGRPQHGYVSDFEFLDSFKSVLGLWDKTFLFKSLKKSDPREFTVTRHDDSMLGDVESMYEGYPAKLERHKAELDSLFETFFWLDLNAYKPLYVDALDKGDPNKITDALESILFKLQRPEQEFRSNKEKLFSQLTQEMDKKQAKIRDPKLKEQHFIKANSLKVGLTDTKNNYDWFTVAARSVVTDFQHPSEEAAQRFDELRKLAITYFYSRDFFDSHKNEINAMIGRIEKRLEKYRALRMQADASEVDLR